MQIWRAGSNMHIAVRGIFALISAAFAYTIYVYLPPFVLNYVNTDGIDLSIATIQLGNFAQLVFYVQTVGLMMVGTTFAYKFAHDKSKIKPIWGLVRIFFKVVFWGIFIVVDFNTIDISANLLAASNLGVSVDLTVLFWFTIGGVIFDIILSVFDFLIAFIPEKKKEAK